MSSLDKEIENLRARAQRVLEEKTQADIAVSGGGGEEIQDAMRLLEELRVYQTELEIQNQDLRQAQGVAEQSLNKYRRLFEHMPIPGVIVDAQGFLVEGNATARTQFGLHQQTALQRRSLYQLFELESRSTVHALLAKSDPHCTATNCTVVRKDSNEVQTVDLHTLRLSDQEGQDVLLLVLFVDRSAEWLLKAKQSVLLEIEAELRLERNRLAGILEGTRAGTWEWGLATKTVRINSRWASMLGYELADLHPLSMDKRWSMVHPDDESRARQQLDSHLRGHKDFYECELRLQKKDGQWLWAVERATVIERDLQGRPLQLSGILIDVTESVQLRERMLASFALLSNLARQIPGVIYQFQMFPDGRSCFPYASEGMQHIYEVSPSEVLEDASKVFAVLHPDDLARVSQSITISAETLEPWVCEYRVNLPLQGVRWRSGTAQPERLEDGSILWHGFIADITEHKNAEERFLQFNRDFEAFLDQTTDFVYFKDRGSRFRFCSQSMATICGFGNWRDMRGMHDREVFPSETAQIYEAEEVAVLEQGIPLLNKIDPFFDVAGHPGFIQTNKWPLFDAQGKVVGIFGISRDVSESMRIQSQLRMAANVFIHSREAIFITEPDGTILDINDSFTRITGYSREDALGNNPRMLQSGRHGEEFYAAMWSAINAEGHWAGEIWNRRKSGDVYPEIITISAVRDDKKQVKNYVCLFTDITSQKNHQTELEKIAHYDILTGLPNRALFADRLGQALLQSQRRNRALSVIFLDLDGFKGVNDAYGHAAGDELLVKVAQRLKAALREGDSLARSGGDEFVAVLVDLDGQDDCLPVLERLLLAANTPVGIDTEHGHVSVQVSASIGMTVYPRDGVDADLLLRHADQAMYLAKQSGKNRYHLFDVDEDAVVQIQRENLSRLHSALNEKELELYYQPKVNNRTGKVVGLEALIRWNHPEKGVLAPSAFLHLVENHPLGISIGEWVIESALQQMQDWSGQRQNIAVSVNVGPSQLQQEDFPEKLQNILARYPDLPHGNLELEILESSAMQDVKATAEILQACRELGVRFSLDDFGTGYSSLSYLKYLPVDTLKIDQSFVHEMLSNDDDLAIVDGVIGLATAFSRHVVAEGVETSSQARKLMEMGCDVVQGYGIARPMPAPAVIDWIAQWRGVVAIQPYK